jgi:prepilin peptidase CpaA
MTLADGLLLAALAVLVAAALFDLGRLEIPDSLSILVLLLAAVRWLVAPERDFWWGLAAVGFMLAIGLLLFSRGWMGGGDVKLLVATAGLVGLKQLPALLLGVALAGGLLALLLLALRAGLAATGFRHDTMPRILRPAAPLPYAVAIAGGSLFWAWRTGQLL